MGYYTVYKAIFDRIKTDIEAKTSIKQVVLGEPPVIKSLPLALINPDVTTITQATFGSRIENRLILEVILIIMETEPSEWFDQIISLMGDVIDAVLADRTLNGTVTDIIPLVFAPGEVKFRNNIYYGGLVRFEALYFFAP
jgi:hypothetical protein